VTPLKSTRLTRQEKAALDRLREYLWIRSQGKPAAAKKERGVV